MPSFPARDMIWVPEASGDPERRLHIKQSVNPDSILESQVASWTVKTDQHKEHVVLNELFGIVIPISTSYT